MCHTVRRLADFACLLRMLACLLADADADADLMNEDKRCLSWLLFLLELVGEDRQQQREFSYYGTLPRFGSSCLLGWATKLGGDGDDQ